VPGWGSGDRGRRRYGRQGLPRDPEPIALAIATVPTIPLAVDGEALAYGEDEEHQGCTLRSPASLPASCISPDLRFSREDRKNARGWRRRLDRSDTKTRAGGSQASCRLREGCGEPFAQTSLNPHGGLPEPAVSSRFDRSNDKTRDDSRTRGRDRWAAGAGLSHRGVGPPSPDPPGGPLPSGSDTGKVLRLALCTGLGVRRWSSRWTSSAAGPSTARRSPFPRENTKARGRRTHRSRLGRATHGRPAAQDLVPSGPWSLK
jgi:hypothetical protein